MSCFAQSTTPIERRFPNQGGVVTEGGNVRSSQFRQYAEEALLWVAQSKTEEEKQLLLGLVRTWIEAAVMSERIICRRRQSRKKLGRRNLAALFRR